MGKYGPNTLSELQREYPIIVEQRHPRTFYRERGCKLLLCYDREDQLWPSRVYQTITWEGESIVGMIGRNQVRTWEEIGVIKARELDGWQP